MKIINFTLLIQNLTDGTLILIEDVHEPIVVLVHCSFMHAAHDELPTVKDKKGIVLGFCTLFARE